jgi:hypothetical protein
MRWQHGCVFKGMMMRPFRSVQDENVSEVLAGLGDKQDVAFQWSVDAETLNTRRQIESESRTFRLQNPLIRQASGCRCAPSVWRQQTGGISAGGHKRHSDFELCKCRLTFTVPACNAMRCDNQSFPRYQLKAGIRTEDDEMPGLNVGSFQASAGFGEDSLSLVLLKVVRGRHFAGASLVLRMCACCGRHNCFGALPGQCCVSSCCFVRRSAYV